MFVGVGVGVLESMGSMIEIDVKERKEVSAS